MGGWGSGNTEKRINKSGSVNDYRRIDSFYFGKLIAGLRQEGRESLDMVIQLRGGMGEMACTLHQDRLEVAYGIEGSRERREFRETFYFSATPNTYGGQDRLYFICNQCERRTRFLHIISPCFECRKCAGLNYPSQQKTQDDTAAFREVILFIRRKFKDSQSLSRQAAAIYIPPRPKGMHHDTYKRLVVELRGLQRVFVARHNAKQKSIAASLERGRVRSDAIWGSYCRMVERFDREDEKAQRRQERLAKRENK